MRARAGNNSLSRKCYSLNAVAPPSACFLFSPPKSLTEIIRTEITGVSCLLSLYPDCDTSDLLAASAGPSSRGFLVEISLLSVLTWDPEQSTTNFVSNLRKVGRLTF